MLVLGVMPVKRATALCLLGFPGPAVLDWRLLVLPRVATYDDAVAALEPVRASLQPGTLVAIERQLSSNAPLLRLETMIGTFFRALGFGVVTTGPDACRLRAARDLGWVSANELARCHNRGMLKRLGVTAVSRALGATAPRNDEWLRGFMEDTKHREDMARAFLIAAAATIPPGPPPPPPPGGDATAEKRERRDGRREKREEKYKREAERRRARVVDRLAASANDLGR